MFTIVAAISAWQQNVLFRHPTGVCYRKFISCAPPIYRSSSRSVSSLNSVAMGTDVACCSDGCLHHHHKTDEVKRFHDKSSVDSSSSSVILFPSTDVFDVEEREGGDWKVLLPPVWNRSSSGVDNVVYYKGDDRSMKIAAAELIRECNVGEDAIGRLHSQIEKCFRIFHNLNLEYSHSASRVLNYKARIKSSRGKKGIGCPRFHTDYVGLRFTCSFAGPGVEYLDVKRDFDFIEYVESNYVESCKKFNKLLLNHLGNDAKQNIARTGDIVVMKGRLFGGRKAAIHKSPDISPYVGRIFLSIDVCDQI